MWVESLRLRNIKCFEDITLRFALGEGDRARPCRWITLLGENGAGKSTALQSLGLLLAGPEAARELLPRAESWTRDNLTPGKAEVVIHQEAQDAGEFGQKKVRHKFSYEYQIAPGRRVEIRNETYTEPSVVETPDKILSWLRSNAFASGSRGWFAAGYGAFRRLTRESQVLIPSLDRPTRASNFATQFDEDRALSTFERWMVHLDFRIAKDPNDQVAQRMRKTGIDTVEQLLPGPVRVKGVTAAGLIEFAVGDVTVPTIAMSDGFRSVVALAGDLVWRLMQAFPDVEDPRQAQGVVLIDELDIHLHPAWQRDIAGWLRKVFPNLQFIVATHSPLIAMGAGGDALTLRFDLDTGAARATEQADLFAMDVGRALVSPAFGVDSARSPETTRALQAYYDLLARQDRLDDTERRHLAALRPLALKAEPIGGPPEPGSLEARINAYLEGHLPQ